MLEQPTFTVDQVFDMLTKQPFFNFYNGDFEDWLAGDEDALDKEAVKAKLLKLLKGRFNG